MRFHSTQSRKRTASNIGTKRKMAARNSCMETLLLRLQRSLGGRLKALHLQKKRQAVKMS
jgi:hypothetical protein